MNLFSYVLYYSRLNLGYSDVHVECEETAKEKQRK